MNTESSQQAVQKLFFSDLLGAVVEASVFRWIDIYILLLFLVADMSIILVKPRNEAVAYQYAQVWWQPVHLTGRIRNGAANDGKVSYGHYDGAGRLIRVEQFVRGRLIFIYEYSYCLEGSVVVSHSSFSQEGRQTGSQVYAEWSVWGVWHAIPVAELQAIAVIACLAFWFKRSGPGQATIGSPRRTEERQTESGTF